MAGIAKVFFKGQVFREILVIVLTVGTWRTGYDRLVEAVDELAGRGVIAEEVIAQIGNGSYKPKYMTVMRFCSPEEFEGYIARCSVVVSHAGVGAILTTTKMNKAIIVVPRKAELKEHDDNHQFITAKQLEAEGKILVAYEVNELPAKLKEAETFVPSEGQGSNEILQAVREFIEDVVRIQSR